MENPLNFRWPPSLACNGRLLAPEFQPYTLRQTIGALDRHRNSFPRNIGIYLCFSSPPLAGPGNVSPSACGDHEVQIQARAASNLNPDARLTHSVQSRPVAPLDLCAERRPHDRVAAADRRRLRPFTWR